MSYVPEIDEYGCSGHGDCAVVAPEVFRVDDIAVVIGEAEPDLLFAAARACPTTAITILDDATGDQVYP
jgi:ferredoxin